MYVPSAFQPDIEAALSFVATRGFGTLTAIANSMPTAVHVPFVLHRSDGSARIELHVARANPIHQAIALNPNVLLVVVGPDAYISPDWYIAKDQVPTWTYVSVHLRGQARLLPNTALLEHADRLSAVFEGQLAPKPPWQSSKMAPVKRQAMLSAIVGIEIDVTEIDGQWKLSQHKPRADRHEVIRALQWRGDRRSADMAELMIDALKRDQKP
jgi:transcriptional regulator